MADAYNGTAGGIGTPEPTSADASNAFEIDEAIEKIISAKPQRITISGVRNQQSEPAGIMRARVRKLQSAASVIGHAPAANQLPMRWQIEEFTKTQSFHHNVDALGLAAYCSKVMGTRFSQLDAWSKDREMHLRLSRRGRVMFSQKKREGTEDDLNLKAPTASGEIVSSHDSSKGKSGAAARAAINAERTKNRLIPEGEVVPALVDLGVFTAEGKVVSSMYDKYKQINRFLEMVDDALSEFPHDEIYALDFGCGKSYLTFILYYYLTKIRGLKVHMTGLDLKADVINKCNATAKKYGYDGLQFEVGDVAGYTPEYDRLDLMITLYACDTATDYALASAIAWNAGAVLSVPCCQHELNAQIKTKRLTALTRYGIIKERAAALMTDAIRADLLEACGYRTQVLEFVDFAHTPKNLLIRAVKVSRPEKVAIQTHVAMVNEVEGLMNEFHLNPTMYRLLKNLGMV